MKANLVFPVGRDLELIARILREKGYKVTLNKVADRAPILVETISDDQKDSFQKMLEEAEEEGISVNILS
jgi:hypothetical protein